MAVLSFICPIAGFLSWLTNRSSDPELACQCSRWAAIGLLANLLLSTLG